MVGINAGGRSASFDLAPQTKSGYKKKRASFPTRRLQTPPLQGVFYEGQLWDACSLVEKLIGRAKKTFICKSQGKFLPII